MAQSVHSVYPQIPSNSFTHGHSNSMNGSFSQSFEGNPTQSMQSTPAQTPVPPRPNSNHMSFTMNGHNPQMMPPNQFAGYQDPNMYNQQPPQQYAAGAPQVMPQPQIYTAVYSNVQVYEMEVNNIAVMKRRKDGWLNATQILKVAGVEKGKRTKVLEKEILIGEHEKVQGGYGKYQGTWISYQRGREFCRQYGTEQALMPLLEYDVQGDGMQGQQSIETPTKEQAMAAQRKRMYGNDARAASNQSQSGTFFRNMSNTAANAISVLNRTRVDSPSQQMHPQNRPLPGNRKPSQQPFGPDISFAGSQQSVPSMHSQDSFPGNNGVLSQNASFMDYQQPDGGEPPRKRMRPTPENSFMNAYDNNIDGMLTGAPGDHDAETDQNQSFYSQHDHSFMAPQPFVYGLEPLPSPSSESELMKKDLLLDLYMDGTRTDFDDHPAFLTLSGKEFEMPIDPNCNTALHWAATLGRPALVKKLIDKGFDIRRTNSGGETALSAACQARNNFDQNTFPQLLDYLGSSIEIRDGRGRTMVHHIAVASIMKGRAAVGKFYLEQLLAYVLKQSGPQASTTSFDGARPRPMTLARFMEEIVNAQDKSGDTALNIAARSAIKTIIDQLVEVGADPHIANRAGIAPVNFGVSANENKSIHDPALLNRNIHTKYDSQDTMAISQQSFEEAKAGFMTCKDMIDFLKDRSPRAERSDANIDPAMTGIFDQAETDFKNELEEKQRLLDDTNTQLKETGQKLLEEKGKLDELLARSKEKEEQEQKIQNLKRFNQELREQLSQHGTVQEQVPVGEADRGLDLDGRLEAIHRLFPDGLADLQSGQMTQEQVTLLTSLERAEVLTGRVQAYQTHNALLENEAKGLRGKNAEQEKIYKRIISICTGTPLEEVDGTLDQLVQAIVSEQKDVVSALNVDLTRVRDFLRMVGQSA